ncbi:restriction endonuclease [Labrys sedimenti]|uniref:restriction endonuclease n=1 Tax=Labrys sedimenti TaxID=3106036 RepID=UPI002ACA3E0D|nr:restriction endonuclease [Labrys sp. ZIDIC5]MDZ5454431.1 restriction endonuclease [Labrys sp. ZIDIC5]
MANNIIFFGYAMPRPGVAYNRHALKSCLIDPSEPSDADWEAARQKIAHYIRQYRQNRNFVRKVAGGSIAMIPQPSRGVIHCGRVERPFELINDPPWYGEWEKIWLKRHPEKDPSDPAYRLASEVAQIWHVSKFHSIPVPRIPAWIRRSLFGRSTYGIVPVDGLDPHVVLSEILSSPAFSSRQWTVDAVEVSRRLKNDLVPASFEHLVVSLLQLEHPSEVWTQVGGSGDGGVDGIGADDKGDVVGLLQCKWAFRGGNLDWPEVWGDKNQRRYVASLIHGQDVAKPQSSELLGEEEIVNLVLKHRERLPLALSLRIGEPERGVWTS